jgi:hypothetical protein
MKNKTTIGSEPSKIHYGGAAKNPPTVTDSKNLKTKDTKNISTGAQESNLKTNKSRK